MEDLSNTGAAAPVSEPVSQEPQVDTSTPADTGDDLDAALREVFEKANAEPVERDETGRFKSKNPAPVAADPNSVESKDQAQDTTAIEAQKPAPIESPVSWSADMKAKFATLPPDVQQYVMQRDKEVISEISKLGNHAKFFEPIGQVLREFTDTFKSKNVSYQDGVRQLLAAQQKLDANPVQGLLHIAQAYGIDLGRLADPNNPGPSMQEQALLSQVNTLQQKIQQLEGHVAHRATQEAKQQQESLLGLVEKFSSDKPDFEELSDDIFAQITAIRAKDPSLSNDQLLAKAYEAAQWANPKSRTALLEKQAKSEAAKSLDDAKKNAETAKKAAGFNVKGQPKANTANDDLDAELRRVYAKAQAA